MSDRKQYDSVAELLADTIDESDLRDWIKTLWDEQRELRGIAFEHVQTIHGLEAELAKRPRTPDGTLVVLGETELWTRHRGETANCWPWQLTRHAGIMFVLGQWRDGCTSFTQEFMLSQCYGTEAALLESEGNP